MANVERVEDAEIVYRSVRDEPKEHTVVDGQLKISAAAFSDSKKRPSVDRARIQVDVQLAKKSESDGVTALVAGPIRGISTVRRLDKNQKVVQQHGVDVVAVPLEENASHAEVHCEPALEDDKVFRRLREALAVLATQAGWVVPPLSARRVTISIHAVEADIPTQPQPAPPPATDLIRRSPATDLIRRSPAKQPRHLVPVAAVSLLMAASLAFALSRCV